MAAHEVAPAEVVGSSAWVLSVEGEIVRGTVARFEPSVFGQQNVFIQFADGSFVSVAERRRGLLWGVEGQDLPPID